MKKSPAPGRIRTHDQLILRRVLYHCAATAAWVSRVTTYLKRNFQEFLYFFLGMIFLYILPLIVIILTYGGIICHLHRKDVRWSRDDEGN